MEYSDSALHLSADVCVIGGGMAGVCAAIAAARHGAKVVLMQDRPVLGGNASSEIRMWIRGAAGADNKETGILSEIELEQIWRNPTMNPSLWDSVLYEKVKAEPNIRLLLNCACLGCETERGRISRVRGLMLNAYTYVEVEAALFADCSGDSVLGPLCGARMLTGREDRTAFGEPDALDAPDNRVMGSSILIQARQTDHPSAFIPPAFAYRYPTDEDLHLHAHELGASGTNFWWIEVSDRFDTLHDTGALRDELLAIAYGVWDHLKNHSGGQYDNWELEWLGFLPGKRETRRYEGPYVLREQDLLQGTDFPDTVAYGGWTMDNHNPLGFYTEGYSSTHIQVHVPYGIPFKSLYSVNVPNLLFAGRNISATHLALSSTRVMATCSVIGQAVGTAAALCVQLGCDPKDAPIDTLQRQLLEDGCMLPGKLRKARAEGLCADESTLETLRNGWERPPEGASNRVLVSADTVLRMTLTPGYRRRLRLALDPDFSRESISDEPAFRKFALRAHITRDMKPLNMPAPLLKSCAIDILSPEGRQTVLIRDNHPHLLWVDLPDGATELILRNFRAWGGGDTGVFAIDVVE